LAVRIVSLLPSATEIVCALGLERALVGRSHECDYPHGIERLPPVSLARIPSEALSSAEIDRRVREALADSGALYGIDEEELAELRPDIVLTQTLCTVCAVAGDGVRSTLRLHGIAADVVELEPRTIDEILDSIRRVADLLGVAGRGARLADELAARLDAVAGAVGDDPHRPRTFVAEWLDPPFAAGHWVPEMVDIAGGREVLGEAGRPSYTTTWGAVRARQPESVILAPCGFDVDRALSELDPDLLVRELADTPALADGQVFVVDATSYVSRPGPRVVDGVELFAALLHPEDAVDDAPSGAWARVAVGAR
jgi:iron complex transport system substrate-binding protein